MTARVPARVSARKLDVLGAVIFATTSGLYGRGVGGLAHMRFDELSVVEFRGYEISATGPTWFLRPVLYDRHCEGEFVGLVMPVKDNAGRPGIFGVGVAISDLPENPSNVAMTTMLQSIGVFFEDVRRVAVTPSNEINQGAFDSYDLGAAPRVTRPAPVASLIKGSVPGEYVPLSRDDAEDMLGTLIWSAPHMRRARGAPVFIGEDVGDKDGRARRSPMDLLPVILRAASAAKAEASVAQQELVRLQSEMKEAGSGRERLERAVDEWREQALAAQRDLERARAHAKAEAERAFAIEAQLRAAESEGRVSAVVVERIRRELEDVRAIGRQWEAFANRLSLQLHAILSGDPRVAAHVKSLTHSPPPVPSPIPSVSETGHDDRRVLRAITILFVLLFVAATVIWLWRAITDMGELRDRDWRAAEEQSQQTGRGFRSRLELPPDEGSPSEMPRTGKDEAPDADAQSTAPYIPPLLDELGIPDSDLPSDEEQSD